MLSASARSNGRTRASLRSRMGVTAPQPRVATAAAPAIAWSHEHQCGVEDGAALGNADRWNACAFAIATAMRSCLAIAPHAVQDRCLRHEGDRR